MLPPPVAEHAPASAAQAPKPTRPTRTSTLRLRMRTPPGKESRPERPAEKADPWSARRVPSPRMGLNLKLLLGLICVARSPVQRSQEGLDMTRKSPTRLTGASERALLTEGPEWAALTARRIRHPGPSRRSSPPP